VNEWFCAVGRAQAVFQAFTPKIEQGQNDLVRAARQPVRPKIHVFRWIAL